MKSMTGFGAARGEYDGVSWSVEVRSVNQRFLDVKLNLPREYASMEADLRRTVGKAAARGRIEVSVQRSAGARGAGVRVQKDAARAYLEAWNELQKELGNNSPADVAFIASRPDVLTTGERRSADKQEMAALVTVVEEALAAHDKARTREGKHLQKDMRLRARALRKVRKTVDKRMVGHAERVSEKIRSRVEALIGNAVDPARLTQEAALLAERADVTEELVRLESHLDTLDDLLASDEPAGKRIDFLIQEIQRELNTIGSKASDIEVTEQILTGKAELEKLREQVQNVE